MDTKHKGHPSGPVVFTANRLRDGRTVWLAPGNRWSEALAEAERFEGSAVDAARTVAEDWAKRQIVVGPYDVAIEAASGTPVTMRERIRALGPSVGPDSAGWRDRAAS